jgi:hypothetical protein
MIFTDRGLPPEPDANAPLILGSKELTNIATYELAWSHSKCTVSPENFELLANFTPRIASKCAKRSVRPKKIQAAGHYSDRLALQEDAWHTENVTSCSVGWDRMKEYLGATDRDEAEGSHL